MLYDEDSGLKMSYSCLLKDAKVHKGDQFLAVNKRATAKPAVTTAQSAAGSGAATFAPAALSNICASMGLTCH